MSKCPSADGLPSSTIFTSPRWPTACARSSRAFQRSPYRQFSGWPDTYAADEKFFEEVRAIRDGGGFGSIIGRTHPTQKARGSKVPDTLNRHLRRLKSLLLRRVRRIKSSASEREVAREWKLAITPGGMLALALPSPQRAASSLVEGRSTSCSSGSRTIFTASAIRHVIHSMVVKFLGDAKPKTSILLWLSWGSSLRCR